jgi:hypothetical protein
MPTTYRCCQHCTEGPRPGICGDNDRPLNQHDTACGVTGCQTAGVTAERAAELATTVAEAITHLEAAADTLKPTLEHPPREFTPAEAQQIGHDAVNSLALVLNRLHRIQRHLGADK